MTPMSISPVTGGPEAAPQAAPAMPVLEVFSTCPSSLTTPDNYLDRVASVARWSEEAGCKGILVYTDNSLVDPWLVSQIILQNTNRLCPLVAVQPVYMHPYSVAKMISSLAFLHGRRVFLNMVAGGFKNDLIALNDTTPHDRRYDRIIEYTTIIKRLLSGSAPVTFEGEFYKVDKLTMTPPLPPELFPGILISGSSEAGQAAAKAIGATAVKYPEPPDQCQPQPGSEAGCGVRVGIVAREDAERAWEVALERFPEDRKGQITSHLATKVSDSVWRKKLTALGDELQGKRDVYWLGPYQNYKTNCPYLVGSHEQVAGEVARYLASGYHTYILDIPADREELEHIGVVLRLARQKAAPEGRA